MDNSYAYRILCRFTQVSPYRYCVVARYIVPVVKVKPLGRKCKPFQTNKKEVFGKSLVLQFKATNSFPNKNI